MFYHHGFQRGIASLLLVTFSSLTFYPLTAAAQVHDVVEKAGLLPKQKDLGIIGNAKRYINKLAGETSQDSSLSSDEQMGKLLNDIHEQLKAVVPAAALPASALIASRDSGAGIRTSALSDSATQSKVDRIRSDTSAINRLYADIDHSFNDTEQQLIEAKLPQEILDRHRAAVIQYQSRKGQFQSLSSELDKATGSRDSGQRQNALEGLGRFMAQYPNARPHQYTNPNRLAFRTPDSKVREPFTSKADFQAGLFAPQGAKVDFADAITDTTKVAQAAATATLPPIPNAADLAETDDIQMTKVIRDQATQLGNNPVKIYNWVRNNIAFIPSYGSIQGSELTLLNKRGNAFDTASLLIALYRAAGIPARYVYGTIEVPVDKVNNWVGGVTKADAAQSLLGQGGIPNVGVISGGTIKNIRMEHVWVEAYVDYTPSRGAVNKTPDAWVAVDASFKQYQFSQGMDINSHVAIDSKTLLEQIKQGATVNEAGGYVQNLNQANLQEQMTIYQNQVITYIDNQKTNATTNDVLGAQTIKTEKHVILMGTLPYKTVAKANTFQSLPDHLRWKFKTNIYAADGISDGSTPMIEIKQNTAKLAGKKITLSFVAASKVDQDLINSYLPKPHADGTPIQPSELPKSLPGYLLRVKAEFRVEGLVVAQTAESFTMGSMLKQESLYFNPGLGTWSGGDDADITVGEYNAIGLNLQGIVIASLKKHQAKLGATGSKLAQYQKNPSDLTPVNDLEKDDLTGDVLQAGMLGYFAHVDSNDMAMARVDNQVVNYRSPSYGRFFSTASPHYFFGVVRSVSFDGVAMDVKYLVQQVEAKDSNRAQRTNYMRHIGSAGSAAEHLIPQFLFGNAELAPNDASQPQGVSAVKLLALASNQGQKIYTLNAANSSLHNTILNSLQIEQDVKAEIFNGLAAGMEAIVHEKDIRVEGWVGNGYVVLDPKTGAAAYKIAGGTNGSYMHLASQYRLAYGAGAWEKIRSDRTASERGGGYSEVVRNAEHMLFAYDQVCSGSRNRASMVLLTYLYFIGKAFIWDYNALFNSSITIPGVGTFDFRKSPLTFTQLAAGLTGARDASYDDQCAP
ncbi:MAG: transglutaminase-like domain-containing protein [Pseudomonadota bacterium]